MNYIFLFTKDKNQEAQGQAGLRKLLTKILSFQDSTFHLLPLSCQIALTARNQFLHSTVRVKTHQNKSAGLRYMEKPGLLYRWFW